VRFINIAEGSLAETEYLITLSRDLAFLSPEDAASPLAEITEIARMLNALRAKVEQGIFLRTQNAQSAKRIIGGKEIS